MDNHIIEIHEENGKRIHVFWPLSVHIGDGPLLLLVGQKQLQIVADNRGLSDVVVHVVLFDICLLFFWR